MLLKAELDRLFSDPTANPTQQPHPCGTANYPLPSDVERESLLRFVTRKLGTFPGAAVTTSFFVLLQKAVQCERWRKYWPRVENLRQKVIEDVVSVHRPHNPLFVLPLGPTKDQLRVLLSQFDGLDPFAPNGFSDSMKAYFDDDEEFERLRKRARRASPDGL